MVKSTLLAAVVTFGSAVPTFAQQCLHGPGETAADRARREQATLYAERLNALGQYLFNGELHSLNCRPETIVVRGAAPVIRPVCESVHGPVIAAAPSLARNVPVAPSSSGKTLRFSGECAS